MKGLTLTISMLLMIGCVSTSSLTTELLSKNNSLVKDVILYADDNYFLMNINEIGQACKYDESLNKNICVNVANESLITLSTKLKKINGEVTLNQLNNHKILEGNNILIVECLIENYKLKNLSYTKNTLLLNTNLVKGHVYELYPTLIKDTKTRDYSCMIELNDTTTI